MFFQELGSNKSHHKVPFENTARPDGMIKLNTMYIQGKLKPFKVKTYRYMYILDRDIKIKLEKLDYPKYDIGMIELNDYIHSENIIIRAWVLANVLNYTEKEILNEYIKNSSVNLEILENQVTSKGIRKVCSERNLEKELDLFIFNFYKDYFGI